MQHADKDEAAQAGIEITPAMIEAGVQVLRESGALSLELSADRVLVLRLLETALAASQAHKKDFQWREPPEPGDSETQ